ncbi:MAG: ASCH domain-containing protein [Brevinema sp.]
MKILLSIRPQYAEAILNGSKTVEFRKTPIRRKVTKAEIYMSRTTKKIVGAASIVDIKEDSPENLWKQFHKVGGITEEEFFKYFQNKKKGFALVLDKVKLFSKEEQIKPKYVPQSFCYIN